MLSFKFEHKYHFQGVSEVFLVKSVVLHMHWTLHLEHSVIARNLFLCLTRISSQDGSHAYIVSVSLWHNAQLRIDAQKMNVELNSIYQYNPSRKLICVQPVHIFTAMAQDPCDLVP